MRMDTCLSNAQITKEIADLNLTKSSFYAILLMILLLE